MLRFKEFLIERIRNRDEAYKLTKYMVKRTQLYKPHPISNDAIRVKINHNHENEFLKRAGRAVGNMAFSSRKAITTELPIDKLIPKQTYVMGDDNTFDHKMKDVDEPISVFKYKNQYHISDGHHRYFYNKMLGNKTIKAKLVDLGD